MLFVHFELQISLCYPIEFENSNFHLLSHINELGFLLCAPKVAFAFISFILHNEYWLARKKAGVNCEESQVQVLTTTYSPCVGKVKNSYSVSYTKFSFLLLSPHYGLERPEAGESLDQSFLIIQAHTAWVFCHLTPPNSIQLVMLVLACLYINH